MIIDHEFVNEVLIEEKRRLERLREQYILAGVEEGHYDMTYHKIYSLEKAIKEIREDQQMEDAKEE